MNENILLFMGTSVERKFIWIGVRSTIGSRKVKSGECWEGKSVSGEENIVDLLPYWDAVSEVVDGRDLETKLFLAHIGLCGLFAVWPDNCEIFKFVP